MKQLYVLLNDEGGVARGGAMVMQEKEAALSSILKSVPFNQVRCELAGSQRCQI